MEAFSLVFTYPWLSKMFFLLRCYVSLSKIAYPNYAVVNSLEDFLCQVRGAGPSLRSVHVHSRCAFSFLVLTRTYINIFIYILWFVTIHYQNTKLFLNPNKFINGSNDVFVLHVVDIQYSWTSGTDHIAVKILQMDAVSYKPRKHGFCTPHSNGGVSFVGAVQWTIWTVLFICAVPLQLG